MTGEEARRYGRRAMLLALALAVGAAGCNPEAVQPGVVLYTDLDRSVVEPIVRSFEQDKKIPVRVRYATAEEKRSGLGLASTLREAGAKAEADVYWSDTPLGVYPLKADGLLERLVSRIHPIARDGNYLWNGVGARVRVLLYDTKAVPANRAPKSFAELALPVWKGKTVLADPRASGSALMHLLGFFSVLGDDDGRNLLAQMRNNGVQVVPDETAVAEAVRSGRAAWGVTDLDVAADAVAADKRLRYVIADQALYSTGDALGRPRGGVPTLGTPLLSASSTLFAQRPHAKEGRSLAEWLISERVAVRLAEAQAGRRLPTHEVLLNENGQPTNIKPANPTQLILMDISPDVVNATRPKLILALPELLGK